MWRGTVKGATYANPCVKRISPSLSSPPGGAADGAALTAASRPLGEALPAGPTFGEPTLLPPPERPANESSRALPRAARTCIASSAAAANAAATAGVAPSADGRATCQAIDAGGAGAGGAGGDDGTRAVVVEVG